MKESAKKEVDRGTPNGAAIISGIEADGRAEEQQIIVEAQNQAAEKRDYTEKKIESVLNDAREEARKQAEAVKKKMISGLRLELRRRSMNIRGAVMRQILDEAEKKLDSMTAGAGYRSILVDWIAEAAIGLGAESAGINASQKELAFINEKMICEVAAKIHAKTGRQVALRLSGEQPLKSQGVVLTAADGRTAFNNQVGTRMLRKEREIRMAIYDTLFADKRKEQ